MEANAAPCSGNTVAVEPSMLFWLTVTISAASLQLWDHMLLGRCTEFEDLMKPGAIPSPIVQIGDMVAHSHSDDSQAKTQEHTGG